MFKKAKENKKGFTLAELLIVVAIIAVLVAISIPIFTSQLEKAREATDAANLRAAYAEVMAAGLTEDTGNYKKEVKLTQTQTGWQNDSIKDIGGISTSADSTLKAVAKDQTITVTYAAPTASAEATVTFGLKTN